MSSLCSTNMWRFCKTYWYHKINNGIARDIKLESYYLLFLILHVRLIEPAVLLLGCYSYLLVTPLREHYELMYSGLSNQLNQFDLLRHLFGKGKAPRTVQNEYRIGTYFQYLNLNVQLSWPNICGFVAQDRRWDLSLNHIYLEQEYVLIGENTLLSGKTAQDIINGYSITEPLTT